MPPVYAVEGQQQWLVGVQVFVDGVRVTRKGVNACGHSGWCGVILGSGRGRVVGSKPFGGRSQEKGTVPGRYNSGALGQAILRRTSSDCELGSDI